MVMVPLLLRLSRSPLFRVLAGLSLRSRLLVPPLGMSNNNVNPRHSQQGIGNLRSIMLCTARVGIFAVRSFSREADWLRLMSSLRSTDLDHWQGGGWNVCIFESATEMSYFLAFFLVLAC